SAPWWWRSTPYAWRGNPRRRRILCRPPQPLLHPDGRTLMEIFLVMVPLSILLIGLCIWIFSWAVKTGQYDDLEGPAHSILFDDDEKMVPNSDHEAKQQDAQPTPTERR